MEKKFQVLHLCICFLTGIVFTIFYWLSLSPLFTMFLGVLVLVIVVPLFIFILHDRKFNFFVFNIVSHLFGIAISFIIEVKLDFMSSLFQLSDTEISAGDGFGIFLYTILYLKFQISSSFIFIPISLTVLLLTMTLPLAISSSLPLLLATPHFAIYACSLIGNIESFSISE